MQVMKIRALEFLIAIALTLAAIVASVNNANAGDVMVVNAVASKSLTPNARSGAVYLTLMNHGETADRLTAITTDAADMAMLHQSIETDGVMRMEMLASLDLPPKQLVDMKKDGLHVMLTGLKKPLKVGGSIKVTLLFENAGSVEVAVVVGDVGQ